MFLGWFVTYANNRKSMTKIGLKNIQNKMKMRRKIIQNLICNEQKNFEEITVDI